jgi:ABC-type transport system involved in cytochrome c biogenesis permease subunit
MASQPLAPLATGFCSLLGALAYAWGWRSAAWLNAAGAAILAGSLIARGLQANHWPLANHYEFALAFALATALAPLVLARQRPSPEPAAAVERGHGDAEPVEDDPRPEPAVERSHIVQAATMVLATGLVLYARLGMPAFKRAIQPLPPALDSLWFPLHVGLAAAAYGALAMAGAAGLVWLVRPPGRIEAERLLDRAIAAGYPFLTLSLIFGMIWAQVAWGRYWGWDLKEAWTLITWLVYTLYWHLRGHPAWRGRRLAWLALAGSGVVLFTFLGTGWLARTVGLESLHLF